MYTDKVYKVIAEYIYKHCGILYTERDYYRLNSRINQVLKELQISDVELLIDKINSPVVDLQVHKLLIDIATNNETYFFRDTKPFKVLTEYMLPELKKMGRSHLKIWSAGCSSGQEAYSIVISLLECGLAPDQFSVVATDISHQILEKAKNATYSSLDVQRGLPITMLMKYFDQNSDDSWSVKPFIKNKVNFSLFNLISDQYPTNIYDVVFCRNVLIYQDVANREAILKKIAATLKADSFLIMGSGESLLGIKVPFKLNIVDNAMLFKKEVA